MIYVGASGWIAELVHHRFHPTTDAEPALRIADRHGRDVHLRRRDADRLAELLPVLLRLEPAGTPAPD